MHKNSLFIYFLTLTLLCAAIVIGVKLLGEEGAYLAQIYMLTPAIAALFTRLFYYPRRFQDANLRFGQFRDYLKFWALSLGITSLSYLLFTLLGAIRWDFSGQAFLERLSAQFAASGQDLEASLPPGFSPQRMLLIYFIGGLTVFNIFPGLITGFGEEFGHRGFMFPQLYQIRPWMGIILGGLIWYAWHIPLSLVFPQAVTYPPWLQVANLLVLAAGAICTHTYLAYVYAKSKNILVTSIAHITLNNSAAAISYFAILDNQVLANFGLALTMMLVVLYLYVRKEFQIFGATFAPQNTPTAPEPIQ